MFCDDGGVDGTASRRTLEVSTDVGDFRRTSITWCTLSFGAGLALATEMVAVDVLHDENDSVFEVSIYEIVKRVVWRWEETRVVVHLL